MKSKSIIISLLFLLMLVLAYPAAWGKLFTGAVPYWGVLPLFDLPALGLLAAALILLRLQLLIQLWQNDPLTRLLLVFNAGLIALSILQALLLPGPPLRFLLGLFYLLLPLAGCLWAKPLKRQIPGFLAVLAIVTLIINFREYNQNLEPFGPLGNWNWSQSLLAIGFPFLLLLLRPRNRTLLVILLGAFAALLPVWTLFPRHISRAVMLALPGATILLILTQLKISKPKKAALAIIIAAGLSTLFLTLTLTPPRTLAPQLNMDSRVQLWRGSLELIKSNLLFGVGPGRFEDEIPRFLPIDYFKTLYASDRHPHPHNELLLYGANFGIAGLLWGGLLIAIFIRGLLKTKKFDRVGLALGFAALVLLIHGQLDVLLSEPLPGGLFLLLMGLFWRNGAPIIKGKPLSALATSWIRIAAIFCVLFSLGLGFFNFRSGLALRAGLLARDAGDIPLAVQELRTSLAVKPTAHAALTLGAIELFNQKKPVNAAGTLLMIETKLKLANYSHTNGLIARALALSGHEHEALNYFAREQRNFPLSAINAKFMLMVLEKNNAPTEAIQAAREHFLFAMAAKGLEEADFPFLLRHPLWDDSPITLKEEMKSLKR